MRCIVAMSGGVDSSVACYLMKKQGYEVVGIHMQLFDYRRFPSQGSQSCCSLHDSYLARRVAEILEIPFFVLNLEEEFQKYVIEDFIQEYLRGRTPNPCVRCNEKLRFSILLEKALKIGGDKVATGHYARVRKEGGRLRLLRGVDKQKDQSYFLFTLSEDILNFLEFPVGELTKRDIRKCAYELKLPVADKPESQEICFVGNKKYSEFIENEFSKKELPPEGKILDRNGNLLGMHKGLYKYTIGQRKGLKISRGKPLYVIEINTEKNILIVGDENDIKRKKLIAQDIRWVGEPAKDGEEILAQIRYRSPPSPARVFHRDGNSALVEFNDPVFAITPGQVAVFYKGEEVIGGGWIKKKEDGDIESFN